MKQLYLVKTNEQTHGHSHMFRASAWLDNEDGTSLLSVTFHGEDEQERFESLEGVHTLVKGQPVIAEHVVHLAHLGVQHGHTTCDVLRLARLRYRAM